MHVDTVNTTVRNIMVLNGTNVDTVDTDYSCELNNSKSESDEVHTLELPLLMFITLTTT